MKKARIVHHNDILTINHFKVAFSGHHVTQPPRQPVPRHFHLPGGSPVRLATAPSAPHRPLSLESARLLSVSEFTCVHPLTGKQNKVHAYRDCYAIKRDKVLTRITK